MQRNFVNNKLNILYCLIYAAFKNKTFRALVKNLKIIYKIKDLIDL